jgi:glycosyltransferase involved in cell wall biosynthesis
VRFEGFVDARRLAELYRECACFVLPSLRGEGLPNVLLEAMAHRRPVVATRVAGSQDLVEHETSGLLTPPGRADALRAALDRLAADPELAVRLATAGRAVAECHGWDRVRPKLEGLLERWAA